MFAGGKDTLTGKDENPFIAQQVSGTLVAIDPSRYMNGGSHGNSGSCIASDIMYDKSGDAEDECCVRYTGAVGRFRQSSWSTVTYLCQ